MDITQLLTGQAAQILALSAVVLGLIGAFKRAGLPSKYAPISAVALGVGLAIGLQAHWLVGVLAGLSSAGLYDNSKSVSPSP